LQANEGKANAQLIIHLAPFPGRVTTKRGHGPAGPRTNDWDKQMVEAPRVAWRVKSCPPVRNWDRAFSQARGVSLPQALHLAQAKLPGQSLPAHAVSLWRIVTYDVQGRNRGGKRNQFPAGGNGLWRASPTTAVVVQKELKVYFNLPDACPVPVKGVFSKLVRALLC
jgi:hypothetical protein